MGGLAMVRIQVLAQSVCVLLWLACSVNSQSPPPRPDGSRPDDPRRSESRERDAFFDAMREFLPHKELFDLLDHDSIRKEIKLSDADAELIEANVRKTFEALHAIRKEFEGKTPTPEEFKQKVAEAIEPLNKESYEILEKRADFERLLGLYVQARGHRALLNDQVAQKIGLEGQALEGFRKLRSQSWQLLMDDTRDAIKREMRNAPPGKSLPRNAISDLFKLAEKKLEDKLSRELTEEQKNALENLKGVKFPLPEHPFNYPPRNRGRGGSRGPGENGPDKQDADSQSRDHKPECAKCSSSHKRSTLRIGYRCSRLS